MIEQPLTVAVRSRPWQLALGGVLLAICFGFFAGLKDMVFAWTNADYSHGFLMPGFVAYLLWKRRAMLPETIAWPNSNGLGFFLPAALLFYLGAYNIAQEAIRGFAILLALAGVCWMFLGGSKGFRWALPGLLFMLLGLTMPSQIESEVSWRLRILATNAATFCLQTLGFATYSNGVEITIGTTKLAVEAACSGLSMLLTFVALTGAIVLLCPPTRRWQDRVFLFLCSVPIAVLCNIGRIVVTGLVYHAGWKQLGDFVVHDLAGWLMMPFAMGMIWLLFKLIDWILLPRETMTAEEYAKMQMNKTAEKMKREDAEHAASVEQWKHLLGTPPRTPPPGINP